MKYVKFDTEEPMLTTGIKQPSGTYSLLNPLLWAATSAIYHELRWEVFE